ncbi:alpha/beta fold hydrolase [Glutamicibacter ardleyensis]|uniref:alpha/beta fold hydrolase n=1 Tax=Glutamicibacter ardleyensis TaxID=225894 RepID=UPI003FD03673
MVLLHGLSGSSRELMLTGRALQECRVLLVDQRGHGRSMRRSDDLSRAAFVGDVVEFRHGITSRPKARSSTPCEARRA